MRRKVLGTAVVLLFLGIIVVIARDNHSFEHWKISKRPAEVSHGDSESGGQED